MLMIRNWYKANQNKNLLDSIPGVLRVNSFIGFKGDPNYEQFEMFDLRYVFSGTFDEISNK